MLKGQKEDKDHKDKRFRLNKAREQVAIIAGKRIKYIRGSKHVSQMKLANDVDVYLNYISDVENGKTCSVAVYKKIAEALNIPLHVLFIENDKEFEAAVRSKK